MACNFQKSLMSSEWDGSKLTTGIYCSSYTDEDNFVTAECPDGALVKFGELMKSKLYGKKDPNVYALLPLSSNEKAEVGVVDYVGVSEGAIRDVVYREGIKLYGLPVPAGKETRVRRLCKHDTAYWSKDNFVSGTPEAGKFATPYTGTDGFTGWKVVNAAVADETCIKIHYEDTVTEGMVDKDVQYFCEVVNVI